MKVVIWGAGQYGDIFYRIISKKYEVAFFIDQFSQKTILNDKPIVKFNASIPYKIYNSVATYEDDVKTLISNSNVNFIDFVSSLTEFPEILQEFKKDRYLWLSNLDSVVKNDYLNVRHLFSEQKSLDIFDQIVRFRNDLDMNFYPFPNASLENQYFLDEIPILSSLDFIRFIDCGAFQGETAIALIKKEPAKVTFIAAFEIDQNNFSKLKHHLQDYSTKCEIHTFCEGVYSEDTILKFSESGAGSNLNESGNNQVKVVTLDHAVLKYSPNYIKMDIEGAEKMRYLEQKKLFRS